MVKSQKDEKKNLVEEIDLGSLKEIDFSNLLDKVEEPTEEELLETKKDLEEDNKSVV